MPKLYKDIGGRRYAYGCQAMTRAKAIEAARQYERDFRVETKVSSEPKLKDFRGRWFVWYLEPEKSTQPNDLSLGRGLGSTDAQETSRAQETKGGNQMTGSSKQYVYSARTTEEGLKRLNELKKERGTNWDDLVNDAMSAHYGIDRATLALPKVERPEKAAAEKAKAEKKAAAEKAKADKKAEAEKVKAAAEKAAADKKAKAGKARADKANAEAKAKADRKAKAAADKKAAAEKAKAEKAAAEKAAAEAAARATPPEITEPLPTPAEAAEGENAEAEGRTEAETGA